MDTGMELIFIQTRELLLVPYPTRPIDILNHVVSNFFFQIAYFSYYLPKIIL